MKKIVNLKDSFYKIRRFFITLFFTFFVPVLVFAAGDGAGGGGVSASFPNPIGVKSLVDIVNAILEFVVKVGAVISILFLVYAGFLFVFARGNESMLTKAKSAFFWTIVGGVIVLGSFVLSEIIKNTANSLGANI